MDISTLPLSELIVCVVSVAVTVLGTRLLDRRKEKREALERRRERIRIIVASFTDLEADLQSLEADFEPTDTALPRIAMLFIPLIQENIELDEAKILQWQSEFEKALADIKTLDVALYMRLLEEKRDFKGFFQMVLIPYLTQYRQTQKERPELISIALTGFLRELRETILGLCKELSNKEQLEMIAQLGSLDQHPSTDEDQQLQILELITFAVPIPLEKPIDSADLKWLNEKSENPALAILIDRAAELLPHLPGLLEKVMFGSFKSLIGPLMNMDSDSLKSWFSIDSEKESEIERLFENFLFTEEEQRAFVGNKEFSRLIVGIVQRFGVAVPFKYKRYLVGLQQGWITANQLIAYLRDGRIPVLPNKVHHTVPVLPDGYSRAVGGTESHSFYLEQRSRLENFDDRIFYHPMTVSEIYGSEAKIGYPLPPYFRDFLAVFGVKQDILPWLLWTDGAFFIPGGLLPEADQGRFITVGRLTGYGLYFLNFSNPNDQMVYKLEFEENKRLVPVGLFPDLVKKGIDEAIEMYQERTLNDEKIRKVEFHFYSKDYDAVLTPILDHIQAEDLPEFRFDTLENDVAIWKTTLQFEGKTVELERHEGFDDVIYPKYFLTVTEPITDLKSGSFVEFIRGCYKEKEIKLEFLEYDFRMMQE